MSLLVGKHYGPERVIRKADEKYHPDCMNRKRQGEVKIMVWGAIIYGVPPADCPFYIWEEETEEEKIQSIAILEAENQVAVEVAKKKRRRNNCSKAIRN